MNNLSILKYRDPGSGRYRWAIYQYSPSVWYFPKRYGIAAARAMINRMIRENAE